MIENVSIPKATLLFLFLSIAFNTFSRHRGHSNKAIAQVKAQFTWSLPARYQLSWQAYNEIKSIYNASYVTPSEWSLNLLACNSSGGGEIIVKYNWILKGITDQTYTHSASSTTCSFIMRHASIKPGKYNLTLTVQTRSGKKANVTKPVEVKDYLIVSIGDSFSSGEGNPDRPGKYVLPQDGKINPAFITKGQLDACKGQIEKRIQTEFWQNRRCHRSQWAAPALAAKSLEEDDPTSSVTFLSFACSGAMTEHLTDKRYRGREPLTIPDPNEPPLPPGTTENIFSLPPQLLAVKNTIRDRTIDALFISIGINDLKFSELVTACGNPLVSLKRGTFPKDDPCFTKELKERLNSLDESYDQIANYIKKELKVKEVYILEYPTNVLEDRHGNPYVCECLDFLDVGISKSEADWLGVAGTDLNKRVARAAKRNGWNHVFGVFDRFQGFGYCAPDNSRFFMKRFESMRQQGERDGAMHPNKRGHEVVGKLLVQAVTLEPRTKPIKRVTVTFEKAKSGNIQIPGNRGLKFEMFIRHRPKRPFHSYSENSWPVLYHEIAQVNVQSGQWGVLPANKYQYSFNIYAIPQPVGKVTDFDVVVFANARKLAETLMIGKIASNKQVFRIDTPNNGGVEFVVTVVDMLQNENVNLNDELNQDQKDE